MKEILHLINEMSPYLLLGFLLAGLMHAFIPASYYKRFLSKKSFRSVVNAALLGIPLPLCSCGVIPTAMSLRREGASRGATTSFLIATPQTGVDSIIATFSLMGLPFAIIRPIAALVTSLFGGALANALESKEEEDADAAVRAEATSCNSCSDTHEHEEHKTFWQRIVIALKYAYVEMMADIGKWLIVGLVVAGLITVFVPAEWFTAFNGNTTLSILLVLAIALPMYVCATGSIPIAVALMMKGLTPGAALVLLMAGPACNFASMLVVRKVMGWRSLLIYTGSIVVGAVAFGYLIDWLQFSGTVDFLSRLTAQQSCCVEGDSWFSWTCTGLLFVMLIYALTFGEHHHHSHELTTNTDTDMETQIYHIEGMTCNHCRMSAEKALLAVEGVQSASVVLGTKTATVQGTATREQLAKAIDEVGFTLTD